MSDAKDGVKAVLASPFITGAEDETEDENKSYINNLVLICTKVLRHKKENLQSIKIEYSSSLKPRSKFYKHGEFYACTNKVHYYV